MGWWNIIFGFSPVERFVELMDILSALLIFEQIDISRLYAMPRAHSHGIIITNALMSFWFQHLQSPLMSRHI